jgi:hypothetical protein
VSPKISWRTAANTEISETSGGDIPAAAWTKLIATAVAPPTSAYALCRLVCTGATITVGGSLYVDELQFEQGTAATDWVPGTGVYPVETLALSETVPFAASWRTGPTLTVREVAA